MPESEYTYLPPHTNHCGGGLSELNELSANSSGGGGGSSGGSGSGSGSGGCKNQ